MSNFIDFYVVLCKALCYNVPGGDSFMYIHLVKTKFDSIVYVSKSVRKGKEVKRKYVMKLGYLSELAKKYDDPLAYANEVAKKMTEEEKSCKSDILLNLSSKKKIDLNKTRLFNAGYLFLQKIYYELSLDKTCKKIVDETKVKYDLNNILKDLVFSRILFPSSKLSTFDLAKSYLEQPNYELHDIYRALDLLSNNIELIQKDVYTNSSKICKRNTKILYYDCTNYFFEIEKEDGFRNYGISKEHRPNPIVQMGLFMDGNGIPLAFNINPGNQSEQLSPRLTEEMIEKDFGLSKFIYCSDAGLGSYNNKWFNQLKDRSFIVTQSLKKLKEYLLNWALDDSNWSNGKSIETVLENEILYKSRPIKEKGTVIIDGLNVQKEIEQKLIVTYSPRYAAYQKQIRDEQIERAKRLLKKPSSFDKYSSTDFKRLIKNIAYDKNGEIINKDLSLDYDLINKESKLDGFYSLVTNLEGNVEEIIEINHNRWEIEESFRIMKTDFKARPVYLQNENRIKSHFLTCYLALLIFRILEQKINTNDNHFTSNQIISCLKDMNLTNINDLCYIPSFTRTQLTDLLEEKFCISFSTEGLANNYIKKQINNSKK